MMMLIIEVSIEDITLLTRWVALQRWSSTHRAAKPPSHREDFFQF